ncbi:MAG: cupin domain-containing protein [Betaproteobacteria bacterium]|nr:cupin domain-containing protein [Betaproteobacteria bacterium]
MEAIVVHPDPRSEYPSDERCSILESWNRPEDPAVSVARARVAPGESTRPHRLRGVIERYVIVEGRGAVTVGGAAEEAVGPGDVVVIPAGVAQAIRNTGPGDLVFHCVCTPRFTPDCYESLD